MIPNPGWAFVVQFDADDRRSGSVEHIATSRRLRFESACELLGFLTEYPFESATTELPAKPGGRSKQAAR
ncbi:MAG: hypothetical protein HY899_09245 [Deltaproteobacteria bacterium]|nr:hypothetical protein [Deltaproteobacteria bacterium]